MKKIKFILLCLFFLISFYITGSKILNMDLINYIIFNDEQISSIKYNNMLKQISKDIVKNSIKDSFLLDNKTNDDSSFTFINLIKKDEPKVYMVTHSSKEGVEDKNCIISYYILVETKTGTGVYCNFFTSKVIL